MKTLCALLLVCTPAIAFANKTYNEGSGGSWDCAKDANITININDATFTFTGACKAITLNGNGNTINADAIATVTANGNNNTVNYGKTKPKVTDNGSGNKYNAGGGGKKADKPAASDDGGGGSAIIDCKKHPTYTVDHNGEQNLKFSGTCTKIEVKTGENNLDIENVKTLVLDGGKNNVNIGGVDAIVTNGAENQVTYKRGISGAKPKVSGGGADNHVVQLK